MEYSTDLETELTNLRDDLFKYLNQDFANDDDTCQNGINLSNRMKLILDKVAINRESTPKTMRIIGEISTFMGNLFLKASSINN